MSETIVVKRYVEAFLDFAKETCTTEKAFEDFRNLKNILRENPEFLEFLENPEITYAEKNEIIDKVVADDFSDETRQFLKLLVRKGRINKIEDIAEYIRITYARGQEVEALLKTSFPLDLDLVQMIQRKMEEKFRKKFKFFIQLDGSLLGGIQVMFGNTIIDGSVRRQLEELGDQLRKVRV